MTLEPNLREALLAIASECHNPQPLPELADWSALVAPLIQHRLMPLAYAAVQRSGCPDEFRQTLRTNVGMLTVQGAMQGRKNEAALASLSAKGVKTLVLKGPALARTVYPRPSMRLSSDLDVLVRQEDWMAAHEALLDAGYRCLQPLTAPPPKVAQLKAYYHTQYLSNDRAHLIEVHYDLWWYGLRPASGELFWQRAEELVLGDVRTLMVSAEDMLLHLCIHLHHHGYDRLIWFTDLALLITRTPDFDWSYLVRIARIEGLGIFVYYSLHYLQLLLGVATPGWVLQALRPGPLQAYLHDKLCPPSTVLAVEISDRAVFDFHEVPEATELVLNFLLTGRRLEKLRYLAHLLLPSAEWLSYYYSTNDPSILRRRRWTHAPALLAKACGELVNAARHVLSRQSLS